VQNFKNFDTKNGFAVYAHKPEPCLKIVDFPRLLCYDERKMKEEFRYGR
jgi:hypothetical protein